MTILTTTIRYPWALRLWIKATPAAVDDDDGAWAAQGQTASSRWSIRPWVAWRRWPLAGAVLSLGKADGILRLYICVYAWRRGVEWSVVFGFPLSFPQGPGPRCPCQPPPLPLWTKELLGAIQGVFTPLQASRPDQALRIFLVHTRTYSVRMSPSTFSRTVFSSYRCVGGPVCACPTSSAAWCRRCWRRTRRTPC